MLASEDEPRKKTTETILACTAISKRSLEEIVSRLATINCISIRTITRYEFIPQSNVKCGRVLSKISLT